MRIVNRAKKFAQDIHEGQGRGLEEESYLNHLKRINGVLQRSKIINYPILVSSWLFGALNSGVSVGKIKENFGEEVARIVLAVATGKGGEEREHYQGIRAAGERAVILKLAQRIAITESQLGKGGFEFCRKDYPEFHQILFREGEADWMWKYLGDITFSAGSTQLQKEKKRCYGKRAYYRFGGNSADRHKVQELQGDVANRR